MRITPLDVRKQEFRRSVRGFDCDEVRAFLATLADEYETVLVDNKQIREQMIEQEDKISEYKTMERTLRDTLMTAEKLMQETRESANREGDLIVQQAHQKAKGILEECRLRTEELRREIVGLRKEKETYLARFKGLAEAQIAFIESHKNDFNDLDKRLVDMVDSVVEGSIHSETEARLQTGIHPRHEVVAPVEDRAEAQDHDHQSAPARHGQEEDMWRDYNPGGKDEPAARDERQDEAATEPGTPQEVLGEGPSASPEAQTSAPEMLVNEVISESGSDNNNEPSHELEDESEAIASVISDTLCETDEKEPQNQ
jgi:cell division initiation protein